MVLIYVFENQSAYAAVCEWLLLQAEAGSFTGIVTPVTMAEIVVKPLQCNRPDIADAYQAAICNAPNVQLCELAWETGVMAGALRAKYGLPLPDMLQAACAIRQNAVLITNDRALRAVKDVEIILLSDLL